jgi:hypothetical protein
VKIPRWAIALLILVWVFVVLYPNPAVLVRSIHNIRHPDIDAVAVQDLAKSLPNDPKLIEQAVLDRIVPYEYDWRTMGVPWYFPTTREVLKSGKGDCESRAIVLASILQAKGIPYQLKMSFDHIWVQYPGKQANALENDGAVLAQRVNGHFVWHWPSNVHLGAEIHAQIENYWTPMPIGRKILLFGGVALLLAVRPILKRVRGRKNSRSPHSTHVEASDATLAPTCQDAGERRD